MGKDCEEKFSKFFSAAKQYYTMQGFQISFLIIKDLMLSSEKLLDKIKVLDCLDGKYEEVLSGLSTQFYKQIDVIEEMVKEDQESNARIWIAILIFSMLVFGCEIKYKKVTSK